MPDTGCAAFDAVVAQLPDLLKALLAAPRKPFAEHDDVPLAPGVYLFSLDGEPIYVGRSKKLRKRLKQHTTLPRGHNQASFAFNLARRDAGIAGVDVARTRDALVADAMFLEHFHKASKAVAAMEVQFLEIDDLIVRAVFEIFASIALGTSEFNAFGEH